MLERQWPLQGRNGFVSWCALWTWKAWWVLLPWSVICSTGQESVSSEQMLTLFKLHCEPVLWTYPNRMKIFFAIFGHLPAVTNGWFPPAALVEIYHEPDAAFAKLQWLHLIIVDLQHPKRASLAEQRVQRHMMDFRQGNVVNTTPIPLEAGEDWRCRYSYGYWTWWFWPAVLPLVAWNFRVVDCETCEYHTLGEAASIATLGLEHFYAAFGLKGSRDLRPAASRALQLDLESISLDWMNVAVPYQLLQHGTPLEAQACKRARRDVRDSLPQSDIEENSSNHPELSGTDASSSSETGSTAVR